MELRLMFHTMWTNSSCHGYQSLEFPVSWVIKFPTLILLYWFISLTPYFPGLPSLREQSRTFHRLLLSSQAFAFCTPVVGKIKGVFSQDVSSSRKHTGVERLCGPWAPQRVPWLLKASATGDPQPRWAAHANALMALVLECFFLPCCLHAVWAHLLSSCLKEIRTTAWSFLLHRSLMLITARASGQPARWDSRGESQEESDGVWEFFSCPTIAEGPHLSGGIWGPLQHC